MNEGECCRIVLLAGPILEDTDVAKLLFALRFSASCCCLLPIINIFQINIILIMKVAKVKNAREMVKEGREIER